MNPFLYGAQPQVNPLFPMLQGRLPLRMNVTEEVDLASISLQIQKKRFYVDVKKNRRGRFMKIAEVGLDNTKARILLTMPAASEVRDKLKDLLITLDEINSKEDNESSADSGNQGEKSDTIINDGLIKSHTLTYQRRRYFLDLKRNRRGVFLRITMMSSYMRVQIAVPSEGIQELYTAMDSLLKSWYDANSVSQEQLQLELPESKSLHIDNRILYFDSVSNRFGVSLRISEVRPSSRTSISLPYKYISKFQDIISDISGKLDAKQSKVDELNDVVETAIDENQKIVDPTPCDIVNEE